MISDAIANDIMWTGIVFVSLSVAVVVGVVLYMLRR